MRKPMKQLMLLLTAFLVCQAATSRAQEFSTTTMRLITMEEAFRLALAKSEDLARQNEAVAGIEAATVRPFTFGTGILYTLDGILV